MIAPRIDLHFGPSLTLRPVQRSRFAASCLPLAEAVLAGSPNLLEAVESLERDETLQYECDLDAVLACLFPSLRREILGFYLGRGRPLRAWPQDAIDTLDEGAVKFMLAAERLTVEEIEVAILTLRASR